MSALRAARVEAVLAHLTGDAIDGYWTLGELRAEFVTRQHWTPAQLDGAIDSLAASGRVQLDGRDGQVVVEVSGLAPLQRVAA
jgi:hypothetical protein